MRRIAAVFAVILISGFITGCERDHFPVSNERKLDHQERVKDKYDVPTNPNDNEEPNWD